MSFQYQEDKTIDLNTEYVHNKKKVRLLALPDKRGKVPIRYVEEGTFSVVDKTKLELLEIDRCKFWWVRDNLYIQLEKVTGYNQVIVPKSAIPKLLEAINNATEHTEPPGVS